MGEAMGFGVEQIGVIGLMVIGISFSGIVAGVILNSDSYQSVAGEFSAVRLAVEMVGTSKQPAAMEFIARLYDGKTYTIESNGNRLLTLTILNADGSVSTDQNGTEEISYQTTNVQMAPFIINSKDYSSRFLVDVIPEPDGVVITVPSAGSGS